MGTILTMNDIKAMAVQKDMPLGVTEAPFVKLEYRADEESNEVTGAYVHLEGYRSIYLHFTNHEVNYQLGYLLEQLGIETYAPDEVNKCKGAMVKVSRYLKTTDKEYSKEEFADLKKKYEGTLPTYMTAKKKKDGSVTVTSTFTNTNFNLATIKEQ